MTQEQTTPEQQVNFPITLNLDLNSVNFILQSLGETKTSSGAWGLIQEIKTQGESQIPPPEATVA